MTEKHFNKADYRIPSFVFIIGVGGLVVLTQLLMFYFVSDSPLKAAIRNLPFSADVYTGGRQAIDAGGLGDNVTIFYTWLIAAILLLSVLIPLYARYRRNVCPLLIINGRTLLIKEKALKDYRSFLLDSIESAKIYVSPAEKRSSIRFQLNTGRIELLQLYHVIVDSKALKQFMAEYAGMQVEDW